MYDRLLELLEQQGEFRKKSPGSPAGGVGSGPAPKSKPFYPRYTASLTQRSTRKEPAGDAIVSQRKLGSGAAMPSLHAGKRRKS